MLTGDYDHNGEVNSADLTPIGQYFGRSIAYDDPEQHGGFGFWPGGDPAGE